ncbi:MAG: hypothetical protein LBR38_01850 [Synergistaceae bacterium]|jgi:epoxyqueuosine reductase QueG|nr:hypothetical protein [Synergistaceae bacterium]
MSSADIFDAISVEAKRFLEQDPCNLMWGEGKAWVETGEKFWMTPLLGVASGDDPIFESFLKPEIGDERMWTPKMAFKEGGFDAEAKDLSVIAWILPHNPATLVDNASESAMPSERWVRSRIMGEKANVKLRDRLVELARSLGVDAVAPMNLPTWTRLQSERRVYVSNWSERHAAHACGLGTFGLCDGLITPVGKAVRIGSIVLRARLAPTQRPYSRYDEYCPFKTDKKCGACISRCPAGALSENGHDKRKCHGYLHGDTERYVEERFGFKGYGCGLCQTGVPCSSRIPPSGKDKAAR